MLNSGKKRKVSLIQAGVHGSSKRPFVAGKVYLLKSGSSIEYVMVKSKLIQHFKSNGVENYILPEPNMTPYPRSNTSDMLLAEVVFTEVEPTYQTEVTDKLAAFDNAETLCYQNQLAWINNPANGLNAAARVAQIAQVELHHINAANRRLEATQSYEKNLTASRASYHSTRKEHEIKVALSLKVLTDTISPACIGIFQQHLNDNHFRRFWYELDKHYSTHTGGAESRQMMYTAFIEFAYLGGDFNAFLSDFNDHVEGCMQSGHSLTDEAKLQHLVDSLRRYPSNPFDQDISWHLRNKSTYTEFISALQSANNVMYMRGEIPPILNSNKSDMQANLSSVGTTAKSINADKNSRKDKKKSKPFDQLTQQATKVCDHCKATGHTIDRCWKVQKCKHCGKVGHSPFFCKANKHKGKNKVTSASDEDTGNDSTQVSLGQSFRDKYPRNV